MLSLVFTFVFYLVLPSYLCFVYHHYRKKTNKNSCGISTHCAFDTVDHDILLGKLEHYRIRRITNKWLETYLKDKQQFILVNGYNLH